MTATQIDSIIRLQDEHSSIYLNMLRTNPMLHTLGEEEMSHLLGIGRWVTFEPGEIVCHQARPVGEIHFLVSGRAKAEVSTPSHGTFVAVLNLLKPGDDIGLLSLVDGAPHSATVITLEHLCVLSIPMTNMRGLLQDHVEWYRVLAEVAVSRLRNSSVWLQALM